MRRIGLIILLFSILLLLGVCVCWGFYGQILQFGFNPLPIFVACLVLSVAGILAGSMMLCGLFDDL